MPDNIETTSMASPLTQTRLKVTEIFYSLQGETKTVGLPTVFVRLTGCPLRCQYCDTTYAFKGGRLMSLNDIVKKVKSFHPRYVTVTGGEPLAQPACIPLLKTLCDEGFNVSLETSGAIDISQVDSRVMRVVDLKTPGSKEMEKNLYNNIEKILPQDHIKFVICDRNDYEWSKKIMREYQLNEKCEVLFSVSHEELPHQQLADWIIEDNLPVRFQLQLHKFLWGDQPGK